MTRESYIYHHGILGQKWGVRRFQNEDGTLTAAGKRRLSKKLAYRDSIIENNNAKIQKTKNVISERQTQNKELRVARGKSVTQKELSSIDDAIAHNTAIINKGYRTIQNYRRGNAALMNVPINIFMSKRDIRLNATKQLYSKYNYKEIE